MKKILSLVLILVLTLALAACGGDSSSTTENVSSTGFLAEEGVEIRYGTLKGPAGVGAAQLLTKSDKGETAQKINYSIAAAPDVLVSQMTAGELDIAAVPSNLAAALYNRSEGKIKTTAVTVLGNLYIVAKGDTDSVKTFADLKGKKLTASGKGAMPEVVLDLLLKDAGLTQEDLDIDWLGEHSAVAAKFAANGTDLAVMGAVEIAMLPEPFISNTLDTVDGAVRAIDMNKEWERVTGYSLAMGALVVRSEFAENHKTALTAFLNEYQESVDFANNNIDENAEYCEALGIQPAAVVKKATVHSNIVFMAGTDAQTALTPLFKVLFDADPKYVGGKLPDENIFN
jgi:ABC-type nitrate/sulfonate/bicarbonate transport systems, periplasmic components